MRVWEADPPTEVEEPVEWILLTRLPVEQVEEAWESGEWYKCCWMIEDDHHCLKTGCSLEKRQLQ